MYRYHFRTEFKTEPEPAALVVEWFGPIQGNISPYSKRSIKDRDTEPGVIRVIESIYDNGTIDTRYESIHKDEVSTSCLKIGV